MEIVKPICSCTSVILAMLLFVAAKSIAQEFDHDTYHRVIGIIDMFIEPEDEDRYELTNQQRELLNKTRLRLQELASIDTTEKSKEIEVISLMLEVGKEFESNLLPHQRKALTQAFYSSQINSFHDFALSDRFVVKQLGLTKEQQEKIADLAKELDEEMESELEAIQKQIDAVNDRHLEKALRILTSHQRKVYKDKFWPRHKRDRRLDPKKFLLDWRR